MYFQVASYHEMFVSVNATKSSLLLSTPLTKNLETLFKSMTMMIYQQSWFVQLPQMTVGLTSALHVVMQSWQKAFFLLKESKAVTWYVWGNYRDYKLCKMVKEGAMDDLFDYLCSILHEFLQHCHVKQNQADRYKSACSPQLSGIMVSLTPDCRWIK